MKDRLALLVLLKCRTKGFEVKMKNQITTDRRAHNRYDFQREIHYIVHNNPDQILQGTTANLSDAGVGLYVFEPLYEGQSIAVRSNRGDLNRSAAVRWCKQLRGNFYRVGLLLL